jgi:hypothetical protein
MIPSLRAQPLFHFQAQDEYYDEDEAGEDYDEGDGSADEADVVVLTTKNFDATIKEHKYVLVRHARPRVSLFTNEPTPLPYFPRFFSPHPITFRIGIYFLINEFRCYVIFPSPAGN